MLKALMPVVVYSIGVSLKKETVQSNTMANMIGVSIGVAIAAYGEAKFDSWGVLLINLSLRVGLSLFVYGVW